MTFALFNHTYTLLASQWLWLLAVVPLFWLPLFWQGARRILLGAALLRSLAVGAIALALAGLSHQTILSEHKLSLVAAVDVSDSISAEARTWMRSYLRSLVNQLEPTDEFAAVSFAADTTVLLPVGAPADTIFSDPATLTTPAGQGGVTNIARALERSFSLYSEEAEKRLVLLTDGNETIGTAKRHIALARRMGIKIFPVIPPTGEHPEVSLEKFIVPPMAREGSVFGLRLVVRNGNAQPVGGTVTILANDRQLSRQAVNIAPGLSVMEVPAQIFQRGNYLLQAELAVPSDTIARNNHQQTAVTIAGKVRALVITDNPQTHLARALQMKEVEVEFRKPEGVPTQLADLLDYNCLVFDDIRRGSLTPQQMEAIEKYVRDFGGGFLLAGGNATFGNLGYKNTPIEHVLPITFQEQPPKKKQRVPVALFIVVDRSNSMGYNSTVRGLHDGQKMEYAKKAAIAVLNQLQDTDLAGGIAFDSEPYQLAPLAPLAQNRADLVDKITRLQYGGGTDFYAALDSAADQLGQTRTPIRHIILLTDGDSNRAAADHLPLTEKIAQNRISLTTIRIGLDTVNLQLLSYMSEKTGGRFYHVEDAETLPQLLVKDTKQAMREQDEEEKPKQVIPRVGARGQILQGLDNFPALEEYMLTKPKRGADIQLYTDSQSSRDPLLATWQYGLGRAVAVTFDPGGEGASEWIGWNGFGKFWSQAVRWAIRDETPWDYRLSVHQRGERTVLQAESYDSDDDGLLQARISEGARSEDLTLMPVAPRVYEATLPAGRRGSVPVTIIKRKDGKIVNQKNDIVLIGESSSASLEEYRQQHPNRDLLRELADATGGHIDPAPDTLVAQKREGHKKRLYPLDNYLIAASLFFLLGDIALRVWWGPPL